jgi:hypothetical protein
LIDGRPPAIVDGVVLEDCGFVSNRGQSSRSGCIGKEMLLTREDLELLKRLQAAGERGRSIPEFNLARQASVGKLTLQFLNPIKPFMM